MTEAQTSETVAEAIEVPSEQEVLASIEQFLVDTGMRHSRFGRDAMDGEASFVDSLRKGRKLTLGTARKALDFIADYRAKLVHDGADTVAAAQQSHGKIGEVSTQGVARC